MVAGRRYLLKCGAASTAAVITTLEHRIAIDTMAQESAATLDANQIGYAHLSLDRPLVFEAYHDDRDMGSFILVDPISHRTAAAGMIDLSLRRATNIHWQRLAVDKSVRARLKQQRPCVLWFTGLSGPGNRRSPISSIAGWLNSDATSRCSTATIFATASTAIPASPTRTGRRTSLPRSPRCSSTPA